MTEVLVTAARWVFTDDEVKRLKAKDPEFKPVAYDEFIVILPQPIADLLGVEMGIRVQRDGTITNRWWDGTVGVPAAVREEADAVEGYYTDDDDPQFVDRWLDIECDQEGNFLKLAKTPA
jgi:hypothetical protein